MPLVEVKANVPFIAHVVDAGGNLTELQPGEKLLVSAQQAAECPWFQPVGREVKQAAKAAEKAAGETT